MNVIKNSSIKQKKGIEQCQEQDDGMITIPLTEDLTNVAYWIYCNYIVESENNQEDIQRNNQDVKLSKEKKKQVYNMIVRFSFWSMVIIIAQTFLSIAIIKNWHEQKQNDAKAVNFFGNASNLEIFQQIVKSGNSTYKDLSFSDIDTIKQDFDLHNVKQGDDVFENKEFLQEALKCFIIFVIVQEVVDLAYIRSVVIKDIVARNKKESRAFYKVFILINIAHIIAEFITFFVVLFFLVYSESLIDTLNNSMGLLILANLHQIGSKNFLQEVKGYHNKIYNDEKFLQVTIHRDEYMPFHFVGQMMVGSTYLMGFALNILRNQTMYLMTSFSWQKFLTILFIPLVIFSMINMLSGILFSATLAKPFKSCYELKDEPENLPGEDSKQANDSGIKLVQTNPNYLYEPYNTNRSRSEAIEKIDENVHIDAKTKRSKSKKKRDKSQIQNQQNEPERQMISLVTKSDKKLLNNSNIPLRSGVVTDRFVNQDVEESNIQKTSQPQNEQKRFYRKRINAKRQFQDMENVDRQSYNFYKINKNVEERR